DLRHETLRRGEVNPCAGVCRNAILCPCPEGLEKKTKNQNETKSHDFVGLIIIVLKTEWPWPQSLPWSYSCLSVSCVRQEWWKVLSGGHFCCIGFCRLRLPRSR